MGTVNYDIALLQRFSDEGDEQAFAQLVQQYAGLVFGAGYRILADRARAEEVAQETCLRLARKPHTANRSVAGWLHRTATQLALDVHRSDTARRRRETSYVEHFSRTAALHPDTVRWADVSPLIDAALDELPEADRHLLIAHFMEGRPQQELARERGISPATLSRQIKSALGSLRAKLARRGVWSASGVLGIWMTYHVQAQPSEVLMAELGKLAMISPDARLPPASADVTDSWRELCSTVWRLRPVLFQVVLLAILVSIMTVSMIQFWMRDPPGPPPSRHEEPHLTTQSLNPNHP